MIAASAMSPSCFVRAIDRRLGAPCDSPEGPCFACPWGSGWSAMSPTSRPLTDRERAILDFERSWWTGASGPKEHGIRSELGISAGRYYEILASLLDLPAAMD